MISLNKQKQIYNVEIPFIKTNLPSIQIGDNLKVGVKIIEGNKERVQFYEGITISRNNSTINTTITVRKILQNVGLNVFF